VRFFSDGGSGLPTAVQQAFMMGAAQDARDDAQRAEKVAERRANLADSIEVRARLDDIQRHTRGYTDAELAKAERDRAAEKAARRDELLTELAKVDPQAVRMIAPGHASLVSRAVLPGEVDSGDPGWVEYSPMAEVEAALDKHYSGQVQMMRTTGVWPHRSEIARNWADVEGIDAEIERRREYGRPLAPDLADY
jgi:hypothetical protein